MVAIVFSPTLISIRIIHTICLKFNIFTYLNFYMNVKIQMICNLKFYIILDPYVLVQKYCYTMSGLILNFLIYVCMKRKKNSKN